MQDHGLAFGSFDASSLVLSHEVTVDARTGGAVVRVPVPATAARPSLRLALALEYASGGGNSPFGLGWTLGGLAAVTVDTRLALPRYDGTDRYAFGGAELVPALEPDGAGGWRPRTATVGDFTVHFYRRRGQRDLLRCERWVETATQRVHWRVRDGSNLLTVFGAAEDDSTRIADADEPEHVFAWLPEARYDGFGNAVRFSYAPEDTTRVDSSAPFERRRLGRRQTQRYLKRIRYGNTQPLEVGDADPGDAAWLFELVLDYGDHSGTTPSAAPDTNWPARADPYSSYRPGFEVRTWRLCRRLLVFHRVPELGAGATLVGRLDLTHREEATGTTLESVTWTGVRRDGATRAKRPLTFRYTEPGVASELEPADARALENVPAGVGAARYEWIDLRGEGLPGILTETGDAWYYKPNEGGGRFGPQERLAERPTSPKLGVALADFDRDGNTDVVALRGRLAGSASYSRDDDRWETYRPFRTAAHVEAAGARAQWLDLDGDGRPELVLPRADTLTWFPAEGKAGFGAPQATPRTQVGASAAPLDEDPLLNLFLADMNGDGIVDQVRVRDGSVEWWPHSGSGRFGDAIAMEDAPPFSSDGDFDPRRLRLVDLDGTGSADLLYLGRGEVRWWRNAGGNQFVEGGRVTGLPYFENTSTLRILDFLGTGIPCLVWSTALETGGAQTRYLPLTTSLRPRLLVAVDNGIGGETRLEYGSSADHYLRDVRSGRGWHTRLPSHVVVVDRREIVDTVGGTRATTRFAYHDGAFDGDDQAFRGFALVERFDAEPPEDGGEELVTPSCVRTWFHTGSPLWYRALGDAFAGDAQLETLPATTLATADALSGDEYAEALRAVAGEVVREETFAVTPSGALAPAPFAVTQTRLAIEALQPARGASPPVFAADVVERITHVYDGSLDDPRVAHHLALDHDAYSHVLLECEIAYPRRTPDPDVPAQSTAVAAAHSHRFVNIDMAERFELGIPIEGRDFELARLPLAGSTPVALDTVAPAVIAAVAAPLAPETPFAGAAPQARVTGSLRSFYWDDALADALALGSVGARTLVHHEETAALTPGLVADVYGGRVSASLLRSLGYALDAGYWWKRDVVYHRGGAAAFFQLERTERWDGAATAHAYDAHGLGPVTTTDAAGNVTRVELDYHCLEPLRVTNPNGDEHESLFDPLGIATVTTAHGHARAADGSDNPYGADPLAAYSPQADLGVDALVADPARFVQGAANVVAYDLDSQPVRVATARREALVHDGSGGGTAAGAVRVVVAYLDGVARPIQEKMRVEPGLAITRGTDGRVVLDAGGSPVEASAAERWWVSGGVVYNAKQEPVREFEPYFAPTVAFDPEDELARFGVATTIRYDALGRRTRRDSPNGTYSLVEHGPWESRQHDENDTVQDSLYRTLREQLPDGDPEKEALREAQPHAGTPIRIQLDPLGREVRQTESDGAADHAAATVLGAEGEVVELVDARGIVALRQRHDLEGHELYGNSADAGETWTLRDASDRTVHEWNGRGVHVVQTYDLLDRPVSKHVDGLPGLDATVEEILYGDDASVVDAAERNLRGRVVRHRDEAGVLEIDAYDPAGNVLRSERRLRGDPAGEPDWGDPASVALELPGHPSEHAYDALGRLVRSSLPDGTVRTTAYLPSGGAGNVTIAPADGSAPPLAVVSEATYNARGQRTSATLGNGVVVEHRFDRETFRTQRITATRPASGGRAAQTLQDLRYTYDPVGNVTRIVDQAQEPATPTPLLQGATVSTRRDFAYDALYQLTSASGRVHQALLEHDYRPGLEAQGGFRGTRRLSLNDGQAVERYTQAYEYDAGGNLTRIRHNGATRTWTTEIAVSATSNRALPSVTPDGAPTGAVDSAFDAAGNCTSLPHLRALEWSYRSLLARAVTIDRSAQGEPDDGERYLYGADGQRVLKRTERLTADGVVETTDRIYLDGCEIKRIRRGDALVLERFTSHLYDSARRLGFLHRWTVDAQAREVDAPTRRAQYPLDDHVGSSVLELDGNGDVIAYEEFLPYGTTAFVAGDDQREVATKDYRFASKERDDATGFYYFGHRYYASWLGRWLSADPAGEADGPNLYRYARNNPTSLTDPDGLQTQTARQRGEFRELDVSEVPPLFRPAYERLSQDDRRLLARGEIALAYDPTTRTVTRMTAREYDAFVERVIRSGHNFGQANLTARPRPRGPGSGGAGTRRRNPPRARPPSRPPPAQDPPPSAADAGDGTARNAGNGTGDSTGSGTSRDSAGSGAHRADGHSTTQTPNDASGGSGSGAGRGVGAGPGTGPTGGTGTGPGTGEGRGPSETAGGGEGTGTETGGEGTGTGTGGEGTGEGGTGESGPGTGGEGEGPGSGSTGTGTGGGGTAEEGTGGGEAGTGTGAGTGPGNGVGAGSGTNGTGGAGSGVDVGTGSGTGTGGSDGGAPGGVNGGVPGGKAGGDVRGDPQGDPRGSVGGSREGVPGGSGTDPNGSSDDRFSSRGGTGTGTGNANGGNGGPGGQGTRPGSGPRGERGGDPQGSPQTTLDRITRWAGYLNLEFGKGDPAGQSGGIPGGFGRFNLGAVGQLLYIAVTVVSFIMTVAEIAAALKKVLQVGIRATLRNALAQIKRIGPALKGLFTRRGATISASLAGNPRAIVRGLANLSRRQARLLAELPGEGARVIVAKRAVGLRDLAALTARTGEEFALFTRGSQRMIVRGTATNVPIGVAEATNLARQGWRWSAHTHPGEALRVLRSSAGDQAVLNAFRNTKSAILNSLGERSLFGVGGDLLTGWLPR